MPIVSLTQLREPEGSFMVQVRLALVSEIICPTPLMSQRKPEGGAVLGAAFPMWGNGGVRLPPWKGRCLPSALGPTICSIT